MIASPTYWEHSPGTFLAWSEFGDPAGKPVFYYHGWPSSRLQAFLADEMARDRGLRLIAMDRPGMGKSTFINKRTLDEWPELMSRFADHLGIEKFGQLGISGGGPYVLACAAKIPERLTASAVLAGMVPLPFVKHGRKDLHPIYRAMIPLRKLPSPFFTIIFRLAAWFAKLPADRLPISLLLRSIAEEDRKIIIGNPKLHAALGKSFSEGVLSEAGGKGIMADAEIYLQKPAFSVENITHTIHYWHGGSDRNIPLSLARELTAMMKNSKLHIDPDLGHFSLAIGRVSDALDLLAQEAHA